MDGPRNICRERCRRLGVCALLVVILVFGLLILLPSCRAPDHSGRDAGIGKRLEYPLFGFTVSKPGSWRHVTPEESRERINSNKLKDEGIEVLVRLFASRPIVVMIKPRKRIPLPSFTVTVNPIESDSSTSATEIVRDVSKRGPDVFRDYSIVSEASEIEIDGHQAAYMKAHYTGQFYDDNREYPVSYETWIVPREGYFFMIGVVSSQGEDEETRREIAAIIKSIELEN